MYQSLSMYIIALKKDFDSFCTEKLQQLELSKGLMFFLIFIGNHPGCSPKDLSMAIKADTGHTTRSVEKLVQGGFVLRKTNETDKRAFQLELTEKGIIAFSTIKNLFKDWDDLILKDVSQTDKDTVINILSSLKRNS